MLAAYTERAQLEPAGAAIIDRLTTLYTRVMFDAVLAKEVERAGRYGYPISLILFDVDRLSAINKEHGYGVGDKMLERLGILIRKYFRQHDWVARHSEDSMVVLLTRTDAEHAVRARRARACTPSKSGWGSPITGPTSQVPVTVSAAVINVQVARRRRASIPSGWSPTRKPPSSARSRSGATASSASTATRASQQSRLPNL